MAGQHMTWGRHSISRNAGTKGFEAEPFFPGMLKTQICHPMESGRLEPVIEVDLVSGAPRPTFPSCEPITGRFVNRFAAFPAHADRPMASPRVRSPR